MVSVVVESVVPVPAVLSVVDFGLCVVGTFGQSFSSTQCPSGLR